MKGFVYILESVKTNKYYLGSCADPVRRLFGHNSGNTKSTKTGRPWTLVFVQEFEALETARKMERKLKGFKSRVILDKIVETGTIETNIS